MRQCAPTVLVATVVDCPRLEIGLAASIETWPELPGVATRSACERARPAMNSVLGMGILNAVSGPGLLATGPHVVRPQLAPQVLRACNFCRVARHADH